MVEPASAYVHQCMVVSDQYIDTNLQVGQLKLKTIKHFCFTNLGQKTLTLPLGFLQV